MSLSIEAVRALATAHAQRSRRRHLAEVRMMSAARVMFPSVGRGESNGRPTLVLFAELSFDAEDVTAFMKHASTTQDAVQFVTAAVRRKARNAINAWAKELRC